MTAKHTTALQALLVNEEFDGDVHAFEPLTRHTTYHIGGPARFYVTVSSLTALKQVIEVCLETDVDWVVVGKGSNLLVADEGYDGVVLTLGRDFKNHRFEETSCRIVAGAGVNLSAIVQEAFKNNLAGMEFGVGTPGTIGGALRMNAGTSDDWLGSRVASVTTFSFREGLKRYTGTEIEWFYRSCSLPLNEVILECELTVEPALSSFIRGKMEAILANRRKRQPLDKPSCGSVFRNPRGNSAGALIDNVGLKGKQIGGIQISPLHANFFVNVGGGTAADVQALMILAQTKVKEVYGIELQPEVRFLGFA